MTASREKTVERYRNLRFIAWLIGRLLIGLSAFMLRGLLIVLAFFFTAALVLTFVNWIAPDWTVFIVIAIGAILFLWSVLQVVTQISRDTAFLARKGWRLIERKRGSS